VGTLHSTNSAAGEVLSITRRPLDAIPGQQQERKEGLRRTCYLKKTASGLGRGLINAQIAALLCPKNALCDKLQVDFVRAVLVAAPAI